MSSRHQLRRWHQGASLAEQVGVALLCVSVLGLLAVSFVPAGELTDELAASSVEPDGDASAPDDRDPATGVGPAADAGDATPGTVEGPTANGDGSATDPGAGGGATPPVSAELGASDQGVTADAIKIGFLLANVGGLDEGGYALGLRTDVDQVVRAFVDHVNANGGVGGRQIEAVIRKTDPVSQEDQIAACTAMAADEEVFAVIGTAALIYAATQRCITIDSRIPMIHSYALSRDFQASAGGYDITSAPDLDRIAAEWATTAIDTGFVAPGAKVGVFTDACEPSNTVMRGTFRDQLRAGGVTDITFAEVDCDPAAQQTQVPNAVLRLKSADVTHAFLATAYIGVQNFLQSAQLQGWHPRYFASPYDGLASNLFTRNFPTEQWDRTPGITYGAVPTVAGGDDAAPGFGRCADIVARRGLPPMRNDVASSEALGLCEHLLNIFVPAAEAAGPELTRAGLVAAVQTLGTYESALYPTASFGPGKVSAADAVATIEWRQQCRCFVRTSPYRPGRF